MADKKASPRCGSLTISLIPFCFSILLFLTRLCYVSAISGSLIPPTLFFSGILLSFLSFPEQRPLYFLTSPFGHIFLSQIPMVRGCCHSLLHVTHPQPMLAFFFSKYIPLYNSKPELFATVLNLVSS